MGSEPQVLSTRPFRVAFSTCMQRGPVSLRVVSPFIGKLPGYGQVTEFARLFLREEGRILQITTGAPEERDDRLKPAEAQILVGLGVQLIIRETPWLHAKVYQFQFENGDLAGFVGSANFTTGGFERNDECIAYFRSRVDNEQVTEQLNRLAGRGSHSYEGWLQVVAREKAKRGNER